PVGASTFTSAVNYTCSVPPGVGLQCSFNPASLAANSSATTVTLSVYTSGSNAIGRPRAGRGIALLLFSVMGIVVGGIGRTLGRKRSGSMLIIALLMLPLVVLPSCGGGGTSDGGGGSPPAISVSV